MGGGGGEGDRPRPSALSALSCTCLLPALLPALQLGGRAPGPSRRAWGGEWMRALISQKVAVEEDVGLRVEGISEMEDVLSF